MLLDAKLAMCSPDPSAAAGAAINTATAHALSIHLVHFGSFRVKLINQRSIVL
jgi:hypothetical protein